MEFRDSQSLVLTDQGLNLNFKATFNDTIKPLTISVKEEFLKLTKLKVSLTRFTQDQEQPDPTDGPSSHDAIRIAKYWTDEYSWQEVESKLNSQFENFTTIVYIEHSKGYSYPDSVPLHFVHQRSPRVDAIPLLFVHGWPGSFLEVENLLGPLTNPPDASLPAFHVVAPSIPGYGFSPSPRKPGFGYRQAGAAFHELMNKLGYKKFVFQGGDAGDFINRYLASDFPASVVSGLSNFWVTPPNESDLERYSNGETSADENYVIEAYQKFIDKSWSYGQIQQTRPLRLAIGLTDSPVGLAMWIYDALRTSVPDPGIWTPDLIITWTMMHWINGPFGAFGLYKNGAKVRATVIIFSNCQNSIFGGVISDLYMPFRMDPFPQKI
jgi:pimeloyl-ACP methyl ester carboxylesterase